jgi:glycosyltransferase involved in cell wall biosynthesis
MKKKRILHLLSSNSYSGAENVVINIIKSLEEYYDFAYASPIGQIQEILKEKNIAHIPIKENDTRSITSIFKEWKPDIIHAHDFRASIKSAISKYSCVKISHLHQNPAWLRYFNLRSIVYSLSCLKFDQVIAVSPQVFEGAIISRLIKDKSYVLNNVVDNQSVLDAVNDAPTGQFFDVAFFGRLTEAKDPIRFIRIINEVVQNKNNLRAVMVGDGELKTNCETMIKNLKLDNIIKMMGFLSNPFPTIKNSKIVVMPSKWEGFGLAAVEAMALGKPVFSTPVGGLQSIVNDDCGGHCDTDEEFTHKIIKSLDDSSYYESLRRNSITNSRRFGDKDKWIKQLIDIYN